MGVRQGDTGVPFRLAAASASILNLCCILKGEELPSVPHQTGHNPALFSALPHGVPCKAGSPHSLKAKSLFLPLSLPILPPSYQTPGSCAAEAQAGAGGQGTVRGPPGSERVAFLHFLCKTCIQVPVSLSGVCGNDGPYMTSSSFTVLKPTGFTSLSCACDFLPPPPPICTILLDASFILRNWSGPRTGVWLKPSGLKIPEKSLHIHLPQNIQRNLFQSNTNRFLVLPPSLPALLCHPNKRTKFQNVWVPRGPSYEASPSQLVWACLWGHGHVHSWVPLSSCLEGPYNKFPQSSWVQPVYDSALLCLCLAVSLLPFKQISLLHCTGLLYF